MEDLFSKKLWSIAAKDPELREALIMNQSDELGLYNIPTRDTVDYLLNEEEDATTRQRFIYFCERAKQMTVAEVDKLFLHLRDGALAKDARGEKLDQFDIMFRDIDFVAFASLALAGMAIEQITQEQSTT